MGFIEAVDAHPLAALAVGAWLLLVGLLVSHTVKECVAILATGKRATEPDWRALSRTYPTTRAKRQRRSTRSGDEQSSDRVNH